MCPCATGQRQGSCSVAPDGVLLRASAPLCILESGHHQLSLSSDKTHIPSSNCPQVISTRRMLPFQDQGSAVSMELTEGKARGFSYPIPSACIPVLSFEAKLWCEKNIYFHSHLANDLGWVGQSLGRCQLPSPLACGGNKRSPRLQPRATQGPRRCTRPGFLGAALLRPPCSL